MSCYILNLGNNDLKLNRLEELPQYVRFREGLEQPTHQEIYKFCWDNYDYVVDLLHFPIAEKILVGAHSDSTIILIATNQSDPHHRSRDTFYLGKTLQRYLTEGKMHTTTFQKVFLKEFKKNPSDADQAYKWFRNFWQNDGDITRSTEPTYASITGGVPAMNMMLLLHGSLVKKEHFRARYAPRQADGTTGTAETLAIGSILVTKSGYNAFLKSLQTAWETHNYAFIDSNISENSQLLMKMDSSTIRNCQLLQHISLYLHHRLLFDFRSASDNLQAIATKDPKIIHKREIALKRLNELDSAVRSEERSYDQQLILLQELYANLTWKVARRDWAGFLSRLYRLREGLLYLLANQHGVVFTKRQTETYLDTEWVEKQPGLSKWLQEKDTEYIQRPVNSYILDLVLEFLTRDEQGEPNEVITNLRQLQNVLDLRNKSLVGHDFQGVSAAIIESELSAKKMKGLDALLPFVQKTVQQAGIQTCLFYSEFDKCLQKLFENLGQAEPRS